MLITKLSLSLLCLIFQGQASSQQGIQSNLSDQSQQFSVLQRLDGTAAQPPLAQPITPQPIARVAQLPSQTKIAPPSSRRQIARLPGEAAKTRPAFELEPRFQLALRGPDLVKAGQLQTFKIRLDNVWPSDSHPIQLQLGIPPGFEYAGADVPARFDSRRNLVVWNLESVSANTGIEINFRAVASGRGPQLHQINLIQDRTVQSRQQLETFILDKTNVAVQIPNQRLPLPMESATAVAQGLPPIVQPHEVNQSRTKGMSWQRRR